MSRLVKSLSLQPAGLINMQWTHYIILILFSGFTGWFTICLVIKIFFWPKKQVSFLGLKFQGLIPASLPAIALQLGNILSNEFLSFSSLKLKAAEPGNYDKLKPEIEFHIDHFLREKLKDSFPMLSMFIGDKTINQLKAAFLMELEILFPVVMKSYISNLEKEIDLQKLIAEKITGFSVEKSGILQNKQVKKLFTRLQMTGLMIGLSVGILQAILLALLS